MEVSSSSSALQCRPYPPPLARYEDVMVDRNLFMDTLEKLHVTMGTKFMIPIIGGKDLDLHRLFAEVTLRGGFEKIIRERKWKEVTAIFRFPASATNASFVLRKYYCSLLHHYEQIYYFKAKNFIPIAVDASIRSYTSSLLQQGWTRANNQLNSPDVETSTEGPPIFGVIDGKFDSGYLITVTIGSEKLKGVLYQQQIRQEPVTSQTHQQGIVTAASNLGNPIEVPPVVCRRRRRKKCEMRKRDPAHPKPNRSGYNFFFAEQHARLKPLYPGKDREISKIIGELWNKMKEDDRKVYQEKAMEDKERYKLEMECYRDGQRTGSIISYAVPIQQRPFEPDNETEDPEEESSLGSESNEDESEDAFPLATDEGVSEFQNTVYNYGNANNLGGGGDGGSSSNFTMEIEMMEKLVRMDGGEKESNSREGMESEPIEARDGTSTRSCRD
ncbi:high mobility group B protein 15-like [Impatiens glandulifera]|uniref:high mobility group B protein 15-like n=1 Tax=Impatiens glandulifera TaxID=253017 RepID=UPI001FB105FD|nr:high mobility group B protein 15-like [Impatiens glandulifera]XP_047318365.1 high mobility group B protein 15-like [Impatiens glandulifera]